MNAEKSRCHWGEARLIRSIEITPQLVQHAHDLYRIAPNAGRSRRERADQSSGLFTFSRGALIALFRDSREYFARGEDATGV